MNKYVLTLMTDSSLVSGHYLIIDLVKLGQIIKVHFCLVFWPGSDPVF